MSPPAQHTWAFTAGHCLGVHTSGKENGSGLVSVQVSASLHRKLQSSRLSALGAAGTCKPSGNNNLLPRRTERVSLKLNAPLSGKGPADLSGRRRIHWSCGRVWWRAQRSEAEAPGLVELRQTTEVMCCESGRVCWSAALPWQDTDPIQPGQCCPGTPVLLLPVRVPVVIKMPLCRSLGIYCLPQKYHGQANFCLNA